MNRLKMLFFVSSILVSASVWAESGGDRVIERMEGLRDKAEATLMKAEQAPEGERHVHMAEHMKMLGRHHEPAPSRSPRRINVTSSSISPGWRSTTKSLMTF
jgi:hypothetical protein